MGGIVTAVIFSDSNCEVGYVKVDTDCVDLCEGINCGIGGNCLSGNCTCQTGYSKVENVCVDNVNLTCVKESTVGLVVTALVVNVLVKQVLSMFKMSVKKHVRSNLVRN